MNRTVLTILGLCIMWFMFWTDVIYFYRRNRMDDDE